MGERDGKTRSLPEELSRSPFARLSRSPFDTHRGSSMLEVLVAIFIMTIGLLGMAAMQVRAQQAELESYQRAQALILASDMVDRINANRKAAGCYNFTSTITAAGPPAVAAGAPFAGAGAGSAPVCGAFGSIETRARADADLLQWHNTLNGAAELLGTTEVGAMIGARGCVSASTSGALNIYRVSVAWQGVVKSRDPEMVDAALTCARTQYGADESLRRIVSVTFPIATLK